MKAFYHPLILILIYLIAHLLIRIIFNDSIQVDDREQILVAQDLLLGYDMPQPPLYSWLAYFIFKVFGANLYALTLLKYSLIFITFIFIHKVASLLFDNERSRSLVIFSFLLMVSFAWHMHQGFTHTIMLSLGIIMSTYYILKIIQGGTLWLFFMLGVSLAIGILGKYSFILYLGLIFLVLISNKKYRKKFTESRFSLTFLTFFAFTLPHFLWLAENWNRIYSFASERLGVDNNYLSFIEVINKVFLGFLGFLSPLIIILFFINFDKLFFNGYSAKKACLNEIFFRNFFLYLAFALIIFALFFEIREIRVRWLHPILMIAPFWFFLLIERYGNLNKKKIKIYLISLISLTFLVFAIRLLQNTVGPQLGYHGRLNIPINETLKSIPQYDFGEISKIKTPDFSLGAHLFSVFKDKTIIIGNKAYGDEPLIENKKCLFLFDNDGSADSNKDEMEAKYGKFIEIKSKSLISKYKIYYKFLNSNKC